MRQRIEGIVTAITAERPGAQELQVRVAQDLSAPAETAAENKSLRAALNLTALTGRVEVGDRLLLNIVAVEMGLGTGDLDFVVAVLGKSDADTPAPGHILKLRYTPMQVPVLAVEAPESAHHETLRAFETLAEMPVVCAELHSQVPAVCAAAHWALRESGRPQPLRIVYIMTDGAALPLPLSRLVPQMKAKGLVEATITAGQAFGGDYEAINLYAALAAAKTVIGADIAVVAQGPGNAGTDTPLGFSGVDQGLAINAADSLGGIPIAVARISFADLRDRHRVLSHHTATVLNRIALTPALVPLPRLPEPERQALLSAVQESGIAGRHTPITIDAEWGLAALEACGLSVQTMGRGLAQERAFFLSAAAAGLLAAQLVEARRGG